MVRALWLPLRGALRALAQGAPLLERRTAALKAVLSHEQPAVDELLAFVRAARLGEASDDMAAAFWPLDSLALGSNRAV